jgi:hypothetical protein
VSVSGQDAGRGEEMYFLDLAMANVVLACVDSDGFGGLWAQPLWLNNCAVVPKFGNLLILIYHIRSIFGRCDHLSPDIMYCGGRRLKSATLSTTATRSTHLFCRSQR